VKMIDNLNETLVSDLRDRLEPGSRLSIAASTFSLYAYEALKEELESIEELRFLFTTPSFTTTSERSALAKERRQFYVPSRSAENSLYGSEFEIRLRNKLTQRAIARECAAWVREKVKFRSNTAGTSMQQFAAVDKDTVYFPLQGFTTADLGIERGNSVSNFVTRFDSPDSTTGFLNIFEQVWNDPALVEDVTKAVCDQIEAVYAENSPERIYFIILYNLFRDFLDDINEDVLPNDLTGYQDTKIWKSLYNFQRDAALGIINKLETYNGCILADSVGLGKTYTALAVIKYYELRNKSVLVLVPKKLSDNWTDYRSNYTVNIFTEDRFNYDVLGHTDLMRTRGESLGIRLDLINWGNYDLVVIDESHNFRNADSPQGKQSRYQRLMDQIIRSGVKTKVLMLSATPVNNRFRDLRNQLALAYEGESEELSGKLHLSTNIDEIFRQAQRAFNDWSKLPPAERTSQEILSRLNFDFFEVLDAVTIARSRKHIEAFYDTSDIGAFPDRLPPISVRCPLTDLDDIPAFADIYADLTRLTLAVYAPLNYVFPSRAAKYLTQAQGDDKQNSRGGRLANLDMAGRQRGIQRLMTTNLLKRLESSVESFRLTLTRLIGSIDSALETIENHEGIIEDVVDILNDFDEDDDEIESLAESGVTLDLADIDTESWKADLTADRNVLIALHAAMERVTPEHDSKLLDLRSRILIKSKNPINPENRKVLIFSAFSDTAEYLYRTLSPILQSDGLNLALVTGQATPKTTIGKGYPFQQVLTLFSPKSKSKHLVMPHDEGQIDVLIGTDCISEGQNLQDCDYVINYDIHWNPVRIIQRFGRIDRIGSTNAVVQLVNYWPDIDLDDYINLKDRVESRMVIADLAATADDNVLSQDSDAEFRKEQLRRLQTEIVDLEDARTGISITDLGLNDFRMDLVSYVREHGDLETTPKGLHAVVPSNPARGLPVGALFALRIVNAESALARHNRLHPHYLVYVDQDGRVVTDHSDAKRLLDLIRSSCRGVDEPLAVVCRVFNTATHDGASMGHYSKLLGDAISSMIAANEERDIDSLFSPGATTALKDAFEGLDDFELVAFLAIVDFAK
jgi:superfamily II DNA or RNA helicase